MPRLWPDAARIDGLGSSSVLHYVAADDFGRALIAEDLPNLLPGVLRRFYEQK